MERSEASQPRLPHWENDLIDEAIEAAQRRLEAEKAAATKRALQLAREKGYHRLAAAIDRPDTHDPNQLRLFDEDLRLFDDAG
ncbi:MAG: hypothetical protein M3280_05545 [Actinomycetota bacterium]|nr:hypothetical protein [Actinomycetota bacterium]